MTEIYMLTVSTLLLTGFGMLGSASGCGSHVVQSVRFRMNTKMLFHKTISALHSTQSDEIFEKAGLHLSVRKYLVVRNVITLVLLIGIVSKMLLGGMREVLWPLIGIAVLFYLSEPREYRGRSSKRTCFKYILDYLRAAYLERRDEELMGIVTQFKNMVVSQSQFEQYRSAESILEMLLRFTSELTRPIFAQTLSLIRLARIEDGAKHFAERFGTKIGEEFASILYKLDALEPAEFLTQINSFQESLREEKRTRRQKKQEQAGRYIFIFASCVVSIVMFDYMYILFKYLMEEMVF